MPAKPFLGSLYRAACLLGGAPILSSCSEVAPVPFTSLEGNWAPRGANCEETALYFQFHEGLAQRLARYEPASDFLFHYRNARYTPPQAEQSTGTLLVEINQISKDMAPSKENALPDWQEWTFAYHMNTRLTLISQNGKQIDKAAEAKLYKRFSLEKCTQDPLYEIEGQAKKSAKAPVSDE